MADDEIGIRESDTDLLRTYRGHIREIFGVEIQGLAAHSDTQDQEECSPNSTSDGHDVDEAVRIRLIALSHEQDVDVETLQKAKAYILSLTARGPDRYEATFAQLAEEALHAALADRDAIEVQSQAVMEVDGHLIHIWGHQVNVDMARSLLDHSLSEHIEVDLSDCGETGVTEAHLAVSVPPEEDTVEVVQQLVELNNPLASLTLSPTADSNNDSCYNSDTSPSNSRRNSSQHATDPHSEVSRTTSDTLASELQDDPPAQDSKTTMEFPTSTPAEDTGTVVEQTGTIHVARDTGTAVEQTGATARDTGTAVEQTGAIHVARDTGTAVEQTGATARDTGTAVEQTGATARDTGTAVEQTGATARDTGTAVEQTGTAVEQVSHSVVERDFPSLVERDFPSVQSTSSCGGSPLEELVASNPEYASKVEFALKLGYSEEQLQTALQKLGADVTQNELLNELICLGSNGAHLDSDDSDCESLDGDFPCPPLETPDWLVESVTVLDQGEDESGSSNLRPIVIDGSNVAMSHGNKEVFSCQGIKLAVEWFQQRGHPEITVFVPQWRKESSRADSLITDQEVLYELERDKVLVFTPARRVAGKRVVCYDDRYILKLAAGNGGIVVSNDNYRDLINENPEYKKVIEERLLMYSFVNDRFMPPDDPLGRHGPSLDNFLCVEPHVPEQLPPICPYGKKCTYGNKCKYYHPERGLLPHKSVTEKLAEQAKIKIKDFKQREQLGHSLSTGAAKVRRPSPDSRKAALTKTKSCLNPASRSALGRTQSLSPAALPVQHFDHSDLFASSLAAPNPPTDPEPVWTRESSPEAPVSISVVIGENNPKYSQYNLKLAECREKMDQADAVERNRRSLAARGQQQQPPHLVGQMEQGGVTLKPPDHWSLGHPQLHPTHSEPSLRYREVGGHLALAKKLSDEGNKSDSEPPRREISRSFGDLAAPTLSPPRQVGHGMVPDSLSPSRHVSHGMVPDSSPRQLQGHGMVPDSSPRQVQGRGMVPDSSPRQVQGRGMVPDASRQVGQNLHRNLTRQLSLKGSEDPRLRQQGLNSHASLKQSNSEQSPWANATPSAPKWRLGGLAPKRDVADWYQSGHEAEERLINAVAPPRHQELRASASYKHQAMTINTDLLHPNMGHNTVMRMASAPVNYQSIGAGGTDGRTVPPMNRQNSSSEPQLLSGGEDRKQQNQQDRLPSVPQSPWNNDLSFQLPPRADINCDGRQTPGGEYNWPMLYNHSNAPGMMTQANPFAMSVHAAPFTPKHSNPPTPRPDMNNQALNQGSMTSSNMTQLYDPQQASRQMGRPSFTFEPASRTDSMVPPDPRYNTYYHLCGLFPEDKVRRVMLQHPEESNPQSLCAYLLSMN